MWIIFLVLVSAGSLSAELINGRLEMVDLEVYYRAAERLVDGGDLYRGVEEDPYFHYVFKYSPPAALLFVPFILFFFICFTLRVTRQQNNKLDIVVKSLVC